MMNYLRWAIIDGRLLCGLTLPFATWPELVSRIVDDAVVDGEVTNHIATAHHKNPAIWQLLTGRVPPLRRHLSRVHEAARLVAPRIAGHKLPDVCSAVEDLDSWIVGRAAN